MYRELPRREFLGRLAATTAAGWGLSTLGARGDEPSAAAAPDLHVAPFRFDVTPPIGHPCCGGWITPVEVVDDALEAVGFVLLGAGAPIVVCAVDWTGLLNEAHVQWRQALAEAAGTTPERVAVQCVHQHNAPFACLDAEAIVAAQGDLPHIVDLDFYRRCLDQGRTAVAEAVHRARRVTGVAAGQAQVEKVASNRRVLRDANGRVLQMRGSSCADPDLRALPEGLIDPALRTVALFSGDEKVVSLHYYATHPMSYYGDGRVSSDFVGLARKRRQEQEPGCLHAYFTGCAGNIAAGKYNDGSKAMRPVLTERILDAIVRSEADLKPEPVEAAFWRSVDVLPPPLATLDAHDLAAQIANAEHSVVDRSRPSYMLSWLKRVEQGTPIVLGALHLGEACLLHLPSECFVEYQLRAQELASGKFVATAAYGDGGPWYIPVAEEYPNDGYEVSVAFCAPEVDAVLTEGMKALLR